MPTWPKPVIFTTRLGPNFLWHVLAVAKIGYDSPYAERRQQTFPPAAFEVVRAHAPSLSFGDGMSGALSGYFAFLPAWLHLETRNDFEIYFAAIVRCMREGSFDVLISAFPHADWTEEFFAHFAEYRFTPNHEAESIASALADAYLSAYEPYVSRVWPEASIAMLPRRDALNEWFARKDYIAAWERALELPFAASSYEIVLCYANENGPDYNSLGYSGNLFYFDKPFDRTWQFASHEIGTHLLFDSLVDTARNLGVSPGELHSHFESLAMFYNRRLLGIGELAYNLHSCAGPAHLEFYEREHAPGLAPKELLERAWRSRIGRTP